MKKYAFILVALASSQASFSLEAWDSTKAYANKAIFWKSESLKSFEFKSIFPKPVYKRSYFGLVLTGATVVGAGVFTYFTAGAGAPVAATGVSTVASWVAGGGAGSYMAGLSTIGGWFGGNAMLGSAILNGISIGVTGGGATFASLPAIGKVGVMTSVTASALDGVAIFQKPDTKNLSFRVRLAVPMDLGAKDIRRMSSQLYDVESKLLTDIDDNKATFELLKQRDLLLNEAVKKGKKALKVGASNEDLIVLGIISKNAGRSDLFEKLVNKVPVDKIKNTGVIDYLKAVVSIENGDTQKATALLWKSWRMNPYAIEPPLLLINILGHDNFESHEEEIRTIVASANRDFDSDKYEPSYSLVSINYRLATMYLLAQKYQLAHDYFTKAENELSVLQKHWFNKSMKHLIQLGKANALYGDDKKIDATELLGKILADAKTDAEKAFLWSQFAGNI